MRREGVASYVFNDMVTAMQQGNVVMVIDGAPLAGRILNPDESKVIDNLGFAVVPGGDAGRKRPSPPTGSVLRPIRPIRKLPTSSWNGPRAQRR